MVFARRTPGARQYVDVLVAVALVYPHYDVPRYVRVKLGAWIGANGELGTGGQVVAVDVMVVLAVVPPHHDVPRDGSGILPGRVGADGELGFAGEVVAKYLPVVDAVVAPIGPYHVLVGEGRENLAVFHGLVGYFGADGELRTGGEFVAVDVVVGLIGAVAVVLPYHHTPPDGGMILVAFLGADGELLTDGRQRW